MRPAEDVSLARMALPVIHLGTLPVRRLVAGSNPISGFSHAGAERTTAMLDYFSVENIKRFFAACEAGGVDAVIARVDALIIRVLREYWHEGGTIKWIAQTAPEHRDPVKNITQAYRAGAKAIYIHGGEVDRLFEKGEPEQVRAQLERIRSLGLPCGMAAHRPAHLLAAQDAGFPVDFFLVCMYQLQGYQGNANREPEDNFNDADRPTALSALARLERPCLAYKVLGAGRKTPREGLRDVAPALRPTDGVVMGMFPPDAKEIVTENVRTFLEMTASRSHGVAADAE
ncbi:hypothetical protein [Sorangium sp. So ce1182]|uniref:hypothetical protein n=1 Tax=Sorangium sp. So ce1182 TaxID=3133334 RepID=UPI003F60D2BC